MMERKISFETGEYYHLYNRGTEKRTIFTSPQDYLRFMVLLHVCNTSKSIYPSDWQGRPLPGMFEIEIPQEERLVSIGAYCLMPNHFHLLVKQEVDGGISRLMLKLQTGYSMYFNKRYERSGALFQGKFQAKSVEDDLYLNYLHSYIHLNPIKIMDSQGWKDKKVADQKRAFDFLKHYKNSSFLDYLGDSRPEGIIISRAAFPEYFSEPKEFSDFILSWLSFE